MMTGPSDAGSDSPELMMDINTTPLIDVMLVLLVMLIITIPIQWHAVNLELPVSSTPPNRLDIEKIQLDIDQGSVVHWQGLPVSEAQLDANLAALGRLARPPEIHLRTDKNARYAVFAHVLAASRRAGLNRVAVIGSEQFVR